MVTGHMPETLGLIGMAIVLAFYLLVGGRVYCSWVCPVNIVTDAAGWLRDRLGIKGSAHLGRNTRYWILGMTFIGSAITGVVLWELINPVSMLHRGLIFGLGTAWTVILSVFLFDLVRNESRLVRSTLPSRSFLQFARPRQPSAHFSAQT
jgi:ferredoxin-type protein NapH